ncbi:COG4223 family protein [Rhizobium sp. SL42]|uniref:COG4223 family protein n=1 Tax=Rhizobium sp. SL42 TaxID=2806346 RepID=UPI001EEEAF14|nr:mitofilin family membrane protein [Rhizobium sp. SL42]UJW75238.1 COG4223 family protein [Rhizobium sp. SL42]
MVSGKPPRRSKSSDDPVTIDLSAEETGAPTTDADTVVASDIAAEGEPTSVDIPVTPVDDAEPIGIQAEAPGPEPEAEPLPKPEPEPTPYPTYEETVAQPAASSREQLRQSPATSTLIASGIFGGLVALALAGSMQYAGIVPGIGPEQPSAEAPADNAELQALKAEVARLASAQSAPGVDNTLANSELADRVAALETSLQAASSAMPPIDAAALNELNAQITLSRDAIAALRSDVARNAEALNQSQARLTEAEKKIEEPRNDVEMARAIALAGLKTAIDRGGPFMSELDALRSVAPEDPAVQSLSPMAATGIPSRADLANGFGQTADAILAAIHQPDPDQGIADRLLSGALSVIKVRPVGNIAGETTEAIVARIENKLQNGDLKGASLEWQTLPEAGKAASANFAETLDKRVAVEATIGEALASTVGGASAATTGGTGG